MSHVATITIDHTKVAADLTDFPVLVIANGDAGWAELYNVATEGGGDIRVFKSDGVTELPREIVSFSVSAETGEIHIKYTGTLSSTVDTDIQIHADGVSSDYAVSGTYGRNAVWSAYAVVFHKQTNTSNIAINSTGGSDGNLSFADGGAIFPSTTTGKIGGGYDYGTSSQKRAVNTQYTLDLSTSGLYSAARFTIQIWAYPTASHSGYLISQDTGVAVGIAYITDRFRWAAAPNDVTEPSASAVNNWYMLHMVKDTNTQVLGYRNATLRNTITVSGSAGVATAGVLGVIHRNPIILPFQGNMDEYRIRLTALTANWITTEYNNQNSPTTFYSVAAEVGSTPQTVTANGRVSAILALLKRYKRTQTANGRASATVAVKKSLKRTITASIRGSVVVQTASVTFVTVTAAIRAAATITDKSINAVAANTLNRLSVSVRRLVRKNYTATGRVSATVVARKTRYVTLTAGMRSSATATNAKRFYETVTATVRSAVTVSRGDIFRNIILTATIGVKARLGEYFYKRKYQEEEEEDYKRKFIP